MVRGEEEGGGGLSPLSRARKIAPWDRRLKREREIQRERRRMVRYGIRQSCGGSCGVNLALTTLEHERGKLAFVGKLCPVNPTLQGGQNRERDFYQGPPLHVKERVGWIGLRLPSFAE